MPSHPIRRSGTKVRAAALTNYLEVARSLGLDPVPLLRKAGISRSALALPDHQIPVDSAVELLEASAAAAKCETFALLMAESRQLSSLGLVGLMISHQRTLRDVLRTMVQYRSLLNESLALDVEDAGRVCVLREEVLTRTPGPARQATELAVAVLYLLCRHLGGVHWRPHAVHFTHSAPKELHVHRRLFRCKLVFDADFNGIVCAAADLDAPNPLADTALADYAERFVAQLPDTHRMSTAQEVRRAVYLLLPLGRATIVQVAESLGMNVRTLQRRLDEERASFSEMVNSVRRELAPRYIANENNPLGRVAAQLGYATPGSFTRWFAAQFGMPPAQWRARKPAARRR